MKYVIGLLVAVLFLAGCDFGSEKEKTDSKVRREQRQVRDEKKLSEPIPVRVHKINGHELISFSVPFKSGVGLLEVRTCFVWRDAEYKTSTLQCLSEADYPLE